MSDEPAPDLPTQLGPTSRRELRERERRLAAADDGAAPTGAPATGADPEVPAPGPLTADVDDAPQHYTPRHYVALVLVAGVLGFLVWTLMTSADDAGATSAAWPSATLTLPDLPAAHQGEL